MTSTPAALIVCLWIGSTACTGRSAPAQPPPASESASAAAELEAPAPADPPAPSVEPESFVDSVIATILDSRPMTMYLHPEVEGRVPVVISGPAVAKRTIEASAQGAVVQQRTGAEVAADPEAPVVIFDRISVTEREAEVELRYPIEGVAGSFALEMKDGSWAIMKAELAEH